MYRVLTLLLIIITTVLQACTSQQFTTTLETQIPAPAVGTPIPALNSETPAAVAEEFAGDGCRIYRNEELGYRFHYPANAQITVDDPLEGVFVIGPMVAGESWPQYTLSHPTDRPDYHPPEDVDLEQWVTNHNLMVETGMATFQIAGVPAMHGRIDRSPQTYAHDRYIFAREGQLYMIIIGHTGDKEDWNLYNHFLESIQFEE